MNAGRGTIYRRRIGRSFPPNGSLKFERESLIFLRTLLDEPVGRFYLAEYCEKKEKKALHTLCTFWKEINRLGIKELSLEDAINQQKVGVGLSHVLITSWYFRHGISNVVARRILKAVSRRNWAREIPLRGSMLLY